MEDERFGRRSADIRQDFEERKICWHFLKGKCNFGRRCWNIHKREVCRYYKQDKCKFGKQCWNIHRKANVKEEETSEFDKLKKSKSMPNVWIDQTSGENEIFEKLGKNGYNPLVKSEILDEEVTSEGKTISKASRKRKNRKKKRINFNDADERSFEAGEQEVVIQREETSESVGARENNTGSKDSDMSKEMKLKEDDHSDNLQKQNDKEFNLNCEELQKKFSMMENPCFHDGRWQEYMEMSQVQRDLHDKREFEEEQKLRRALGLI